MISLGLGLNACDDYVDIEPIGPTSDNYFNNEEEYEAALIGAYDMLQSTFWNVLTGVVASDDVIAGGDTANFDQPTLQRIDKMDHTPDDTSQIRDIWRHMFAGIQRVNFILEHKDKIDFNGKETILAQAYFLRAYYTFELAKFFGDIPLKVEERNGVQRIVDSRVLFDEELLITKVGSIAEVYALIEEDLKEAIEDLPIVQAQNYAVTKGAAQSLLGKVYLYHGKFDATKFEASAAVFQEVINASNYSLVDFEDLFSADGENGAESIFEIQYTNVEAAGWDCIECSEGTYFPKFNAPRKAEIGSYTEGWGFNLPTQALYDAYDVDDLRRDETIWDLSLNTDYEPSRENTGYFSKKYLPTITDEKARVGSDPLNFQNNYRAIRYADVLLMAAEAEIQSTGSIANATSYLNQVRSRAFGNNTHDYPFNGESDLLQAIYDERRLELAGEGHRFFDLVRTGKAADAFNDYNANRGANAEQVTFDQNKNEVFPIPVFELNLANAVTRWGQNTGY